MIDIIKAQVDATRTADAAVVKNYAYHRTSDCDNRGSMDRETGGYECEMEKRGSDCRCAEILEFAEEAAKRIMLKP